MEVMNKNKKPKHMNLNYKIFVNTIDQTPT